MKKKSFKNTFLFYLITLFSPVFLVILGILFYISLIEIRNKLTAEKILQENLLKENQTLIKNKLDQVYSDVNFLSELPEIRNFYEDEDNYTRNLNNIIRAFAKNRKLYHQIRIIDTMGWEKIRIEYRQEKILTYTKEQMQNKSNRYYFNELNQLSSGEFYISQFDLNVDNNAIEVPYIPVLRFGRNIINPLNGQRIILIVNFLGNEMLDPLHDKLEDDSTQFYLVNQDGYYLIGPDTLHEWRFHFSDSLIGRFATYFPSEWNAIQANHASGHLKTNAGHFTFLKINLCDYFLSRSSLENSLIPQPCKDWILISYANRHQIMSNVYIPTLRKQLLYALIAGLVLFGFTYIYSKIIFQRIKEKEQRALHYQFLKTLIETFPHPIFYIDYTNNELDCNEAFELLTGKKKKELKNIRVENLFEQSARSKSRKKAGNEAVKVSEIRLKYPNKSIHSLLYYKANIMMHKNRIGFVGVFTDITNIREAENALRDSEQKLLQANRTKDRFFSLIAHDLKNPFHAIMGLSHLLMTNYDQIVKEDQKSIVNSIHRSAENTYQLLINLLDWARLQEGKIRVKPEKIKLHDVAQESLELFHPIIEEKKIHVSIDIDFELKVKADINMVRTIFRNLIGNAVKFTEDNGRIHISALQVMKDIEVRIADTGIGINSEDLKYLFRLDKKKMVLSNDNGQSSGLGLILCREFVEMNQGRIWAESSAGKGSIFYFTLPLIAG